MTEQKPRPCQHTAFAVVAVLLAGLALGAFSAPPAPAPAPAGAEDVRDISAKMIDRR